MGYLSIISVLLQLISFGTPPVWRSRLESPTEARQCSAAEGSATKHISII